VEETGRCFETRKKEHIRNVKTCTSGGTILLIIDKGFFVYKNHYNHGTLLLSSTRTIIPSRSLNNILFFIEKNSLIYTFLLLYCSFDCLVSPHFVYILDSLLFHFLSIKGCCPTTESSIFIPFYSQ